MQLFKKVLCLSAIALALVPMASNAFCLYNETSNELVAKTHNGSWEKYIDKGGFACCDAKTNNNCKGPMIVRIGVKDYKLRYHTFCETGLFDSGPGDYFMIYHKDNNMPGPNFCYTVHLHD